MSDARPLPRGPGGSPRPPEITQPRWVRVVYAGSVHGEHYVAVSQEILGWYVHWLAGHTRPCLMPMGNCECESQGWLPYWKGYLGVVPYQKRNLCVLEITEHAWASSPDLRNRDGQLRASLLKVNRLNTGKRAAVALAVLSGTWKRGLPPEFDVSLVLSHLWGIEYAKLRELADAAVRYVPRAWKGAKLERGDA
jgi:hypothetical protein